MKTLIYTPSGIRNENDAGAFRILKMMVAELLSSRELVYRLFLRDFKARYRQSALGVLWAFLMPLVTVSMFLLLRDSGLVSVSGTGTGTPYPLYAITGLSIWGIITSGVNAAAASLVNAGSMVVKINFPKIALILAACIQSMVDFFIRMALIGGLFIYFGFYPSVPMAAWALISLLPVMLLTFGLGCILSLVSVLFRDIGNITNLGFTALLLVTPVLYPMREGSVLARLNCWNPFNYLINVPRDLLLKGQTEDLYPFVLISTLCLAISLLCWRFFHLAQTKISERV
jgi:lipopolysaccharide transport system permease protein